jgi:hypothetical protein
MKYALQVNEEEASLFDVLWLLLASVIFVPIFQKIPGGKVDPHYIFPNNVLSLESVHFEELFVHKTDGNDMGHWLL